jgi:hypothetical protein
MREKRWLLRLGPPLAALGILAVIAVGAGGAARRAWEPPACGPGAGGLERAVADEAPSSPEGASTGVWYRTDPQLADGELAGQRLKIGWGTTAARILELPPESFAAGPFGRIVLVGTDDGRSSTLHAIDLFAGCSRIIATDSAVIRRATLAPDGRAIYLFRVDRTTRADLGVSRRSPDGSAEESVLDPLSAEAAVGQTFTTELAWSAEGDRLVVQSCGAVACRTRLLDPATSRVMTVAGADQGELVGVAGGLAVFRLAGCGGLPCAIRSVDIAAGATRTIADAPGLARLVGTDRGVRLVHEIIDHGRLLLRVVTLTGDEERTMPMITGLRLVPQAAASGSATRTPLGWALLARGGRVGLDPQGEVYIRLEDGAVVGRQEVFR